MKICLYGASSNAINQLYIDAVEKLGQELAKRGHSLIYGGGAGGLMGAAARGVSKEKGEIIGISPDFFNVDGSLYDKCTELIYTKTMRERKKLLQEKADAFIIVPGGPGTFDELFETLALRQLSLHQKPLAIFNINSYYTHLIEMLQTAADEGFMPKQCLDLLPRFTDADGLLTYLETYNPEKDDFSILRKLEH